MKRIGILYDKDSKKVFLLPKEVKALVSKGITVNIASGLGESVGVLDGIYASAGAKVYNNWQEVINASDVLLKTNAFSKTEIKAIKNKTAITMANYLVNVDMLLYMLQEKTNGLAWSCLNNRSGYPIFSKIEEAKAQPVLKLIQDALKTGLAKKEKDKVVYPKNPSMLILNATFMGVELAKLALAAGFNVTIADNDTKYLLELKNSFGLKKLDFCDSSFDTLIEKMKKTNIFVNTAIAPTDVTKLRITKEMVESMPKGSLAIDAACENGYAFHFVKKYADEQIKWNKLGKSFYLAHEDLGNYIAAQTSEIISSESLEYLIEVASKGADTPTLSKIAICRDGKVVNYNINTKLHLY